MVEGFGLGFVGAASGIHLPRGPLARSGGEGGTPTHLSCRLNSHSILIHFFQPLYNLTHFPVFFRLGNSVGVLDAHQFRGANRAGPAHFRVVVTARTGGGWGGGWVCGGDCERCRGWDEGWESHAEGKGTQQQQQQQQLVGAQSDRLTGVWQLVGGGMVALVRLRSMDSRQEGV